MRPDTDSAAPRLSGLELREIGKHYRRAAAVLTGVTLSLRPGEVVGVTGGNGSGKSTLLRIIVGLTRPSTGTVTGRPGPVGYVPERFPTHSRISARAYLTHLGRIRGLGARAAATRADALLDRLGLIGGAGSGLRLLSKGNAQKVALAQALLVPPRLLVLDEPWSGLDTSAHAVLAELIAEVAGDGGLVVFTDHRDAVVRATASAVYRIADGRVLPAQTTAALPAEVPAALATGPALVVLAPAVAPSRQPDWDRLPGVLEATVHSDGSVAVTIADRHCDDLLHQALGRGWSVREVRRRGPTGEAG